MSETRPMPALAVAAALALGSAVSLGLARFSYALLLPPMRADLGWTYLTAGAMNTVNAAGYLVGALLTARLLERWPPRTLFLGGMLSTAAVLALHGTVVAALPLYALRLVAGVGSAATFVSGGLLAARLVLAPAHGSKSGASSAGLLLGVYYSGTGAGIVASALLVPPLAARAAAHAWQGAWLGLGLLSLLGAGVAAVATRAGPEQRATHATAAPFDRRLVGAGLASYFLFGLGYIGYMTFVVTLLREEGLGAGATVAFYVLLGAAVIASSWVWAPLLHRSRAGGAMAVLNTLLAVATVLPVLSAHPVVVFASGLLFGGVFLSLVASTTALVRHSLPHDAWAGGIAAFTVVFAFGQIVGPSLVGWVADAAGGLRTGFACSAAVLVLAAIVATRQRAIIETAPSAP